MIKLSEAYYRLRNEGFKVDETFQPQGVSRFCLGWKYLADGKTVRTVFSDGSVADSTDFPIGDTGMVSTVDRSYEPGKKFPKVEG